MLRLVSRLFCGSSNFVNIESTKVNVEYVCYVHKHQDKGYLYSIST